MASILDDFQEAAKSANGLTNPFVAEPAMRKAADTAIGRAQAADDILTQATAAIKAKQDTIAQVTTQRIEAKKEINKDLIGQLDQTSQQLKPLFNQRKAIADRQEELQRMNPLVRGIRGLFDSSYDDDHLDALDRTIAGRIRATADVFDQQQRSIDNMNALLDENASGEVNLAKLAIDSNSEDIRLSALSVQSAQEVLRTMASGVQAGETLIRAQMVARADTMATLTDSQLGSYIGQAAKNGGEVTVNGTPLRIQELKEIQMARTERNLSFESKMLAIQGQRMDLARQHEINFVRKMTKPEVLAAIKSNGAFGKQVLPMDLLQNQLQTLQGTEDSLVTEMARTGGAKSAAAIARLNQETIQQTNQRALELFGQIPQGLNRLNNFQASQFANINGELQGAAGTGTSHLVASSKSKEMIGMYETRVKAVDAEAKRWAGGDKDLYAVASAYLTGNELSSQSAVKGLIKMARTGAPKGTRLTGAAKAAFDAARQTVANFENREAKANNAQDVKKFLMSEAGKQSMTEKQLELEKLVGAAVSRAYNGSVYKDMTTRAPEYAKTIPGRDGKPHPASKIPVDTIARAEAVAKVAARERFGNDIPPEKLGEAKAFELQEMLNVIDREAGSGAADQYVDLLNDRRYQETASTVSQRTQQVGFMDYVAGRAGPDSMGENVSKYGSQLRIANEARKRESSIETSTAAARFRGQPLRRMETILSGVPGINAQERAALVNAVKDMVASDALSQGGGALPEYGSTVTRRVNDQIDAAITSGKFQNPQLERVRQIAAKNWEENSRTTDSIIDSFLMKAQDVSYNLVMGSEE